ncbi:MAG: hypothetical protein IPL39_04580 [Opitutaceae bacterium]|nr:hypothetical protein [Opitutaceae bacterium]
MNLPRQRWLMALLCLVAPAWMRATDENLWPLRTTQEATDGSEAHTSALGPLFFDDRLPDRQESGLRPLFLHRAFTDSTRMQDYVFFPVFFRESHEANTRWSILSLINFDRRVEPASVSATAGNPARPATPSDASEAFDLWPFYFSRQTGDPATSYRAVLPLYGTIKRRFGNDRIDFTLFPLYSRWQKDERVETDWLWPFVREIHGGGESGFALWPLYGERAKNVGATANSRFILWPFWLQRDRQVEGGTDRFRALFPFYSERHSPTLRDTSTLLFFGTTHATAPVAYDETRYFWPFFVQGHGADGRRTNRWAPFYTRSVKPTGDTKSWVLWPLYREANWTDAGLAQRKTQFLYFVYWNLDQRDPLRPAAAHASKTHLWPLFSAWDNGAGRRQVQLLSPFEVFYPHDSEVRTLWSPLFALYRSDRRSTDAVRTSFLFDCVTYRREASNWRLDLGPLGRVSRTGGRTRFSLLPALFSRPSSPPSPAASPSPAPLPSSLASGTPAAATVPAPAPAPGPS